MFTPAPVEAPVEASQPETASVVAPIAASLFEEPPAQEPEADPFDVAPPQTTSISPTSQPIPEKQPEPEQAKLPVASSLFDEEPASTQPASSPASEPFSAPTPENDPFSAPPVRTSFGKKKQT